MPSGPLDLLLTHPADDDTWQVERLPKQHGHSTPQMAARVASRLHARHLALTHFSPRYVGDQSQIARGQMAEIRDLAARDYAGPVTTAVDLLRLTVEADGRVEVRSPKTDARIGGGRSEQRLLLKAGQGKG